MLRCWRIRRDSFFRKSFFSKLKSSSPILHAHLIMLAMVIFFFVVGILAGIIVKILARTWTIMYLLFSESDMLLSFYLSKTGTSSMNELIFALIVEAILVGAIVGLIIGVVGFLYELIRNPPRSK